MKLEKKLAVLFFIVGLIFIAAPTIRTGYLLGIETDVRANYCYSESFPEEGIECAIYNAQIDNWESLLYLYRIIGLTLIVASLILYFHKDK